MEPGVIGEIGVGLGHKELMGYRDARDGLDTGAAKETGVTVVPQVWKARRDPVVTGGILVRKDARVIPVTWHQGLIMWSGLMGKESQVCRDDQEG